MGRPRKFDEEEVLTAVRDQFWAKGYAATSLDDLLTATGLGKGSLYCAFGDKHQLFLAVLDAYTAWRLEAMRGALQGDGPAIDRLRALFRVDDAGPGELPPGRGCMLVNSTSELAPHDQDVVERARAAFGAVEDLLVHAVEQARDQGDLPADTNARELGRLLLAILQGQEFLAKTGMAPAALDQIGRATASRLLGDTTAKPRAKPRSQPSRKRSRTP